MIRPSAEGVATTCPYCGVGCGLRARVEAGRVLISGDPAHPANTGRLCSKGAALADTLDLEDRLLYPEVDGRRASWDAALGTVAHAFRSTLERHGPDAVAFYVSGQLLTEDYYVANKLMKGFLGGANIDTNSRLCMASAVAGHQRAFGEDVVPGCYEDFDLADLVVLVGSNTAWCHPVIFQRITHAKATRGTKLVVIDPRATATSEAADLHLALKPGSDALLFNGLLDFLRREDALDYAFIERHTEGIAAALEAARASASGIPTVARGCGLPEEAVAKFFRLFARTPRAVTAFSQGVNQSSRGTDKVNAIINCHLATGRIGKPGAGPFSITGQPNAMGGREVGGVANQLAAHMGFAPDDVARVARFWDTPRVAATSGRKAVELFQAIEAGAIKALWIMATNPVVSLPEADRVRAALRACDFVVVSDVVRATDTVDCARVRLPAAAWGEKDGTVTNSERCISRQRAFLPPPGEARPDWWIVTQVARRLGFAAAFPYEKPADVFREHTRLSAFENDGARAFDLGALSNITDTEYDALEPARWPLSSRAGTARVFGDGRFYTPSGRARLLPVSPRGPENEPDSAHPLILNTGRVRDHWHTLTRTAKSARLSQHTPEPFVALNPDDALAMGLADGEIARVERGDGGILVRASVSAAQPAGQVFVPLHWNDAFSAAARVGAVIPAVTDPVSGQPEFKAVPVRVRPWGARWYAFVLTRERLAGLPGAYWTRVRDHGFWRFEMADTGAPPCWNEWARAHLGADGEWVEFEDRASGRYRAARLMDARLHACLFVAPTPVLPARAWLGGLFSRALTHEDRAALLSGRAPRASAFTGQLVCACHGVREAQVREAVRQGARSVEDIGRTLHAGTNCGSCTSELRAIVSSALAGAAG